MKVSANSQLEMIIREAQADNVQGDVVLITDAPAALAQLLPEEFVQSYLPEDMAAKIPAEFRNPLAIRPMPMFGPTTPKPMTNARFPTYGN